MIMNAMMNESWVGDKWNQVKTGVKNVASKVWQAINGALTWIFNMLEKLFQPFFKKLKAVDSKISSEVKEFMTFLYASLISNDLVSTEGKIKWSETVDSLFGTIKQSKTVGSDPKSGESIDKVQALFKSKIGGTVTEQLQTELTESVLEAWYNPKDWFKGKDEKGRRLVWYRHSNSR